MRAVAGLVVAVIAVYAGLLALLWAGQEKLLFVPSRLPADFRFGVGADVRERWIDVDGARLNALHLERPGAKGVVFFLHGNAGDLSSWFVDTDLYRDAGMDLFMIDYRGYGKSTGRIASEAELMADVRAAWRAVAPAYEGRRRVIVGRSLGSGPAAMLAAEVQPDALLLISPYLSMQALAAEHYPWVPGSLLRYPLRTDLALPRVTGAVTLVHGELDTLIEPSHGSRLQALHPPARLVLVPGAGHNDLQGFPAYLEAVRRAMTGR